MCEQRRTKLPRQLTLYPIDRTARRSAGQSTIDDEFDSGDIGCIIGGKEQSQPCDVFRFCEPLERDGADNASLDGSEGFRRWRDGRPDWRSHGPWCNGIDANSTA